MRLLDLFCCQGGAAMGYHWAGFDEIVGVDNKPQPRYPFAFVQMDALEALRVLLAGGCITDNNWHRWYLENFDAIHGSPPCQGYSKSKVIRGRVHPKLIESVRAGLRATFKPYVIENVPGAPLKNPVTLVGTQFGLSTMRERLFECSFPVPFALAPPAYAKHTKMGRPPKLGEFVYVVGNASNVVYNGQVLGIDWMTGVGLSQAVPPAYTEYIGHYLLVSLAVTP